MLIKAKTLKGYKLDSLDGEIGKIREFYFDDRHWTVRYLIANTGNWLGDRMVLISPYALGSVSKEKQQIAVNLTNKQIEGSPALGTDKPVSKQFEQTFSGYYGWPAYWNGPYAWGPRENLLRDHAHWLETTSLEESWDPCLRSTDEVGSYHIKATDGEVGHVDDFIIDDETWAIRYLVIDTRNWWPGRKVIIAPKWIGHVDWSKAEIAFNISREAIKDAPEYTGASLLTRDYETRLHRHYDRKGYWVDEPIAMEPFPLK